MEITKEELAGMIDHSLLRPQSTREELKKLCAEAVTHGFKAVCVNPVHVADAAALLKGGAPLVCSVVGFPFETHTQAAKAAETAEVIRLGAKEVDMVLRIGSLKEGRGGEVAEDIALLCTGEFSIRHETDHDVAAERIPADCIPGELAAPRREQLKNKGGRT